MAARDDLVVAQGYFGHVLYQYNVKTKKINKKELGTYKGHVSRNIFMDHRGHVYGIRARLASSQEAEGVYKLNGDRVRISLTELDTQLREIHDWPLSDYEPSGDTGSHGITGFSEMLDGSIVFVTHSGALWRVRMDGRDSQLERLGWLNPLGKSYCASLFCPYGDRYVCGFVPQNGQFFWSVFDIRLSRSVLLPFDDASQKILTQKGLLVYGCETLDDNSNAYVVGWKVIERGNGPFIFRLRWE